MIFLFGILTWKHPVITTAFYRLLLCVLTVTDRLSDRPLFFQPCEIDNSPPSFSERDQQLALHICGVGSCIQFSGLWVHLGLPDWGNSVVSAALPSTNCGIGSGRTLAGLSREWAATLIGTDNNFHLFNHIFTHCSFPVHWHPPTHCGVGSDLQLTGPLVDSSSNTFCALVGKDLNPTLGHGLECAWGHLGRLDILIPFARFVFGCLVDFWIFHTNRVGSCVQLTGLLVLYAYRAGWAPQLIVPFQYNSHF